MTSVLFIVTDEDEQEADPDIDWSLIHGNGENTRFTNLYANKLEANSSKFFYAK